MSPEIIFEDNHLLIVNKPAGMLVQEDVSEKDSLENRMKDYIRSQNGKEGNIFLGVVHRLDRPVSGLVLFAKSSKALTRLNEMMKDRQIQKTYWAIVKTAPPSDRSEIRSYLKRDAKKNKSYVFKQEQKDSKLAILDYQVLGRSDNYFLLEIHLHTGRHHQIRAQLASIGCPIKGDLKYGFARSNPDGSISLHARSLSFLHPVKKEMMKFVAKVPHDNLWMALSKAQS